MKFKWFFVLDDDKMPQQNLFGEISEKFLDIIPTSVVDVKKSGTIRRNDQPVDFDSESALSVYSEFHPEICKLCYELFLRDATLVFDPFAGWGERHHYATLYKKTYRGFDLNQEAIDYAKKTYNVENAYRDTMTIAENDFPNGTFNGVITSPPYWNRELYADDSRGGDRQPSWEGFLNWYKNIWVKVVALAAPNTTFCVVVGNWRKDHKYYDLVYQTQKIFDTLGLTPIDMVVVSRKIITKIKVMIPQTIREGYTINLHEILLVYRK